MKLPVNEIWLVSFILKKKISYQKILQKLRPETSPIFFRVCKELGTASVRKSNF